jgi:hypothetical protein
VWRGTLAAQAGGPRPGTLAGAVAAWGFGATNSDGPSIAYGDSAVVFAGQVGEDLVPSASRTVVVARTFAVPVGTGGFVDFSMALIAGGAYELRGDDGEAWSASIAADFSHTAGVTGLRVLDGMGQDITAAVPYTFASGTGIHPELLAPEPTPGALVAGALLLAARVARRRTA